MLEIVVSFIGLAVDLAGRIAGWAEWEEADLLVDNGWLLQAIDKGILDGAEGIALVYLTAVK